MHMNMNTIGKRLLAFLLCLSMVFGILPAQVTARGWRDNSDSGSVRNTETTDDSIVVIAGSDFQNSSGHEAGAVTVTNILSKIQADYPTADGFLFAGDYDYNYSDSAHGKAVLQKTVQSVYPEMTDGSMIWVQGNHDGDSLVGTTLSSGGAHDTENYGVYVINEQDYMWYNNDEDTIRNTATALKTYLDEKVEEGYAAPVFVMSHLPLHYSMRTLKGGNDGMHANYIFDVLNEAGADGLNIIFLFGHNHSHGWDDYIGGAAIYLTKGDSINIAQNSTTTYTTETLNFTYLNAGYVGYYGSTGNGSDQTLTMTVFEIGDDQVTVSRYDENGLHNLKAKGVYGGEYPDNKYASPVYAADTTVVESPQVIALASGNSEKPEVAEQVDEATGITVSTPGITGLSVDVLDVEIPAGYSAYVSYDITPEGYTQGDEATVTIPVDLTAFDENRSILVLDQGKTTVATIQNGSVTFTTDHFSVYTVAQAAEAEAGELTWVEIPGGTKTIFRLTDSLSSRSNYLIVSSSAAGSARAVNLNDSGIEGLNVTVIADEAGNYIDAPATTAQWYYDSNGRFQNVSNTNRYLRGNGSSVATTTNTNNSYVLWSYSSGLRARQGNKRTYRYLRSDFTMNTSSSASDRVYIYKAEQVNTESVWVAIDGQTEYTFTETAYVDQAAVLAMLRENLTVYTASDANGSDAAATTAYTITGTVDPATPGRYTLTVSYDGVAIGAIDITVVDKIAVSIIVDPMTITVQRGTPASTVVGTISVIHDDGTPGQVPLTLARLVGDYDLNKNGTYTGLSVTHDNLTVTGITLNVVNVSGNDFPEYPDGGSVNVSKTVSGDNFQTTGVARVELSTSGLPSESGVDVIVMVDTSSSMNGTVSGSSKTRLQIMKESLGNMITQFNTPVNGQVSDIRVAVADFNNYYSSSSSAYYLDSQDHLTGYTTRSGSNSPADQVYTGDGTLTAGAFVQASTLNANSFTGITCSSGTNYDYAFDAIYQLGSAIQAENASNNEERDLFVIFMSDGAPYQYNYFSSQSDPGEAWNDWLTGTYASADAVPTRSSHAYYYNGQGNPHRMAEAIKGDPSVRYTVIRKNTSGLSDVLASAGQANLYTVPGLGATMYSIGFCLETDKDVTLHTQTEVIRNLSSGAGYYYDVDSASELDNAFSEISGAIRYAAQNAYFEDQMGSSFDLQMSPVEGVSTDITVSSYPIYTEDQVGTTVNGHTVTADDVGKTYGSGTVQETVSFTVTDGVISAASTAKSGELMVDGVICAKNFWYNTNNTARNITLDDGSVYSLPAETFYWNIGTINEQQFVLSYAVYLTGSMEGNAAPGSYDTNNYATLSYTNWLGNDVSQSVPSPTLPWGGANVSYAFYLVDSQGRPVVNQTTGETGNIINAVKVTQPVLYKTINLNSGETVMSAEARAVLPDGYVLYDETARYTVTVKSGEGSNWVIEGTYPGTTYITGYAGTNEYSNATPVSNGAYDYTHTTVYFAVKWVIGTVPDTVVVDYGLPVDITVLHNDMFSSNGKLIGVGTVASKPADIYTTTASDQFSATLEGDHGDIAVRGSQVRYSLTDMELNTTEKFCYEVEYTATNNSGETVQEYYYGDVTVVPATTVYYEDSFLSYAVYNDSDNSVSETVKWEQVGDVIDATQDEDRPGKFSLSYIDANNIYGYDSAYANMSAYSMGGAMKVTVDSSTYAKATFSFCGTGFDVISLTSNTTGTLLVKVTRTDGQDMDLYKEGIQTTKSVAVDTYYGYQYVQTEDENGEPVYEWVAAPDEPNALYQVPVIKVDDLLYGKYDVEIIASYVSVLDHTSGDGYELYLDAVRIYDPAKGNAEVEKIHAQDGEGWPVYSELREWVLAADDIKAESNATGIVFIDGKGETASIADYRNYGPNNELYLTAGQSVAFELDVSFWNDPDTNASIVADIQLGIKSADGNAVNCKIYDASGKEADANVQTVSSATDMFYSINSLRNKVVVIHNAGGGILSLTDIKFTFTENPNNFVEEVTQPVPMVVNPEVVSMALLSLRDETPGETTPEPEVEPFLPDAFKLYALDKAYVGNKVTVTVTTSRDVAALAVNGEAVGKYYENSRTKQRIWTTAVTAEAEGELTIEAVAYNAEGLASEPITDTVTVKLRSGNPIRDLFDWLFG